VGDNLSKQDSACQHLPLLTQQGSFKSSGLHLPSSSALIVTQKAPLTVTLLTIREFALGEFSL